MVVREKVCLRGQAAGRILSGWGRNCLSENLGKLVLVVEGLSENPAQGCGSCLAGGLGRGRKVFLVRNDRYMSGFS